MQESYDARATVTTAPTTRPTSRTYQNPIAEGAAPVENGYRYDSFPGYSTAITPGLNGVAPTGKVKGTRALAPDLLRGLLMMIMAFDHAALTLRTWEHGTGRLPEADGTVIRDWNFATAYIVRTLTHLCAPGFTFLLGMGVVYLGRSRTKLGWGSMQLARYLAIRCVVLTIITAVFGAVVTGGRFWFMNAVLFALAVDYLLAGLLWLVMNRTEPLLSHGILKLRQRWAAAVIDAAPEHDSDEESMMQPLLPGRSATRAGMASDYISWVIHNALLLVLCMVTILWNMWLSDDGGVCKQPISTTMQSPQHPLLRIWFWVMMDPDSRIMSGFPPLAWLSFAVLGILYGRILTARPWSHHALVLGHASAAVSFTIFFILTRILRFGNLSEGCLQTPDQLRLPQQNPYLGSLASFFYVVKYPPDVAFFALTMAGNMMLMAVLTAMPPSAGKRLTMLLDFGTSALFFYIMHMLILLGLGSILVALFGHDLGRPDPMDPGKPARGIDSLWAYFTFWAAVMLILWPLCRSYSRWKSTKAADSIWRVF